VDDEDEEFEFYPVDELDVDPPLLVVDVDGTLMELIDDVSTFWYGTPSVQY
jgi:hypothetical protein